MNQAILQAVLNATNADVTLIANIVIPGALAICALWTLIRAMEKQAHKRALYEVQRRWEHQEYQEAAQRENARCAAWMRLLGLRSASQTES